MFNHHLIEDQCSITVHSIFDHVFSHLIEEERNTCENKNLYIWKFVSAKRNIRSLMTFVIYVYNNIHNSDAMICYITFLFYPIYALSMFNHCSINGTFSWKDRHMFWTLKPTRTEMHARLRRRALEVRAAGGVHHTIRLLSGGIALCQFLATCYFSAKYRSFSAVSAPIFASKYAF